MAFLVLMEVLELDIEMTKIYGWVIGALFMIDILLELL
jgi:hypothetical protein